MLFRTNQGMHAAKIVISKDLSGLLSCVYSYSALYLLISYTHATKIGCFNPRLSTRSLYTLIGCFLMLCGFEGLKYSSGLLCLASGKVEISEKCW